MPSIKSSKNQIDENALMNGYLKFQICFLKYNPNKTQNNEAGGVIDCGLLCTGRIEHMTFAFTRIPAPHLVTMTTKKLEFIIF